MKALPVCISNREEWKGRGRMKTGRRLAAILAAAMLLAGAGCTSGQGETSGETAKTVKLDPNNPVSITLWHYYNGSQKNALTDMVEEFNKTDGRDKGIVVEAVNLGSITELKNSILDSAAGKVGSDPVPNIFAAYADTAYQIDSMGLVTDLSQYLTQAEIDSYIPSYIEEGRMGKDNALKIFPTAKSTEVFMLNRTDWDTFAAATGADIGKLSTIEGVTATAKAYYEWTDSLTPEVKDDGKAFFGRDAVANYFIIGCRQLGAEIFQVKDGAVTFQLEESMLRKLWDNYYVPFIHGYFAANGKFRSDDAKVGDILALVGSSTTASYFPAAVIKGDKDSYDIKATVLPAPRFEGGRPYAVQQGAGMVVTNSTAEKEFASVEFLKWFTQADRNLSFSVSSGYLPVKKEANTMEKLETAIAKLGQDTISENTKACLKVSMQTVLDCNLYTNRAFSGGNEARNVLETTLTNLLKTDGAKVAEKVKAGVSRGEAAAALTTDEHFREWTASLRRALDAAVSSASAQG